jgi:hypothetical protein
MADSPPETSGEILPHPAGFAALLSEKLYGHHDGRFGFGMLVKAAEESLE